MNRRDYLKQMALGGAVAASSRLEIFSQYPRRGKGRSKVATMSTIDPLSQYFQNWPNAQARPMDPPVFVTFYGLLDFYYNASGAYERCCGIGFSNGGGHHTPRVDVLVDGVVDPRKSMNIDRGSEVGLGIVGATPEVKFLETTSDEAFRWVIDMQSDPWYRGVGTKPGYKAKLYVRNGTFFTRSLTRYELSQFDLGSLSIAHLSKTADVVGCNFNLAAGQTVLLKVNGREFTFPERPGLKYEIRFSNLCTTGGRLGPCDFYWWSPVESLRNDFHHHRDALDLKPGDKKYSVILKPGVLPQGRRDPPRFRDRLKILNTNDAPCMAAGYGGGNGPS